jgi:hypothetical protein
MSRWTEWLESRRKKRLTRYDESKKEFEKIIGKPSITITLDLPKELEDLKAEFLRLEKDDKFLKAVEKLVEKSLKKKRRHN